MAPSPSIIGAEEKQAGNRRVEFASLECAVARTVQHRGEAIAVEQPCEPLTVFGVTGNDARTLQPEVAGLANAEHAAGILPLEVSQRMLPGDSGNAGNQQRQRRNGSGVGFDFVAP